MPFFVELIKSHHGEFNSLLDLGCGELCEVFKKRWGERYEGMDVRAEIKADYHGDCCDLSRFPTDSRDVVTGWSYIEHVKKPYEALMESIRVCRGTCIFTTDLNPHDKNGDASHLYSWTPKTFKQLLDVVHRDNKVYAANNMLIGVLYRCSTSVN